MSKLETREISKTYRRRRVVDDVSVFVQQGEVVGLLGPNGAGKTTTFYMIVGLISPDSGRILVDEEDITGLPMYQRARRGISYLPQEASIFRKLTVEENLMAILETLPLRSRQRRENMEQLIEQLGLEKGAGAAAHHLRFEAGRHWHPGHRPQRPRDPAGDRPGLHHQQWPDLPRGQSRGPGPRPRGQTRLLGRIVQSVGVIL